MAVENGIPITGIFDEDGNQLFVNTGTMKISISPVAQLMDHPLESGSTISDHIVFLPTEAQLTIIVDAPNYQDTYQQINDIYRAAKILTIQAKAARYESFVINGIPHEETPGNYDTLNMVISLREVDIPRVQFGTIPLTVDNVAEPRNSSTVDAGQKESQSAAADIFDSVFG